MATARQVNAALAAQGKPERLVYNRSGFYYYFTDGNSACWYETIVGSSPSVRNLTVERIVALRDKWEAAHQEEMKRPTEIDGDGNIVVRLNGDQQ